MNERQRIRDNNTVQPSPDNGHDDESLERIRRTANEFLSAGDDAIRRALSADSEEFLRANRQHGGQ
jgi:hypothetical protein